MKGRLNLFQAGMLRWRDLAPYNAVHVVKIAAPLDRPRLQAAIDDTINAFGLTGFALDRARGRFEYRGGAARATVAIAAPAADADETLRAEIERQLNTPFPSTGAFEPMRFFAVDLGASFYLGLAYDHVIAAADSIVALLAVINARHRQHDAPPPAPKASLYPPTYRPLFLRHLGAFLRGLSRVPRMVSSFRRAFRPRYPHGHDTQNGYLQFRIGRPGWDAMRTAAKDWGVTLNDLWLAMLLHALSPATEARREATRRNELAVASIANIRADCGAGARTAFGQFLSSFLVSHPVPEGVSLRQLAADVRAETRSVKENRLYLQTLFGMAITGLLWRFLAPDDHARFLAKSYPVWAGMTSLNVEEIWVGAGGQSAPEYLRAVCTGPHAPLVTSLSAAGGTLHVGISFRTAAFTRDEVAKIAARFLACVEGLAP